MVLLAAAAAILCGVVVVAMGRGGEMVPSVADSRPMDEEILTAADVALLRPPVALWGYDIRATDQALNTVARTVTERDVEIATLRRQIADLQSAARKPPDTGAHPAQPPADARPPADAGQWSAWQPSHPAPSPEPGEPGENG